LRLRGHDVNFLLEAGFRIRPQIDQAPINRASKEAIYDKSALEAIRNVPGKGRPKKPRPEGQG